jgi:multiple sugar transport system substrate-binding protein
VRKPVAVLAAVLIGSAGTAFTTGASAHRSSQVTLTVLEHQTLRVKALKSTIIPAFEAAERAKGKDVKVNLVEEILPDDQFATKLTLQYSQGKGPDVTSFVAGAVPDFAAAGYLMDLTSRTRAWPDWKKFYPRARDLSTQGDGKIYSLPRGATVLQLFYRRDVLQKNGISTAQPASWKALIDRMVQLEKKISAPAITFPAGTQWGGGTFDEGFVNVLLGTGSKLYDASSKKWIVRSPGLSASFNFYYQLKQNDLLPVNALLSPQPWQPTKYVGFVKGTLPVTTSGSWAWQYDWGPDGAAPIPQLTAKVGTWLFPSRTAKPFVTANLDWAWAIAKSTKNPDVAWDWVTFLNTGKALAQDITAAGSLSPRSDIRNVAPYSKQKVLVNAEKELATGRFFRPATGIVKIQQAVGKATEDILTGKADGKQAADEFATMATKLLGSNAVKNG